MATPPNNLTPYGAHISSFAEYFQRPDAYIQAIPKPRAPTPKSKKPRRKHDKNEDAYVASVESDSSEERRASVSFLPTPHQSGTSSAVTDATKPMQAMMKTAEKQRKREEATAKKSEVKGASKRSMQHNSMERLSKQRKTKISTFDTSGAQDRKKAKPKARGGAETSPIDLTLTEDDDAGSAIDNTIADDNKDMVKVEPDDEALFITENTPPAAARPSVGSSSTLIPHTADFTKLRAQYEECQSNLKLSEDRILGLENEIAVKNKEHIAELRRLLSEKQADEKLFEETTRDFSKKIAAITEKVDQDNSLERYATMAEELRATRENLTTLDAKKKTLDQKLDQEKNDKLNLHDQLKVRDLELATMKSKLDAVQAEIQQLTKSNATLEATHETPAKERDNAKSKSANTNNPPLSASLPITADEQVRIENVRKTYVVLKLKYDNLYAVTRDLMHCTRGMHMPNFGELGRYLTRMRSLVDPNDLRTNPVGHGARVNNDSRNAQGNGGGGGGGTTAKGMNDNTT